MFQNEPGHGTRRAVGRLVVAVARAEDDAALDLLAGDVLADADRDRDLQVVQHRDRIGNLAAAACEPQRGKTEDQCRPDVYAQGLESPGSGEGPIFVTPSSWPLSRSSVPPPGGSPSTSRSS